MAIDFYITHDNIFFKAFVFPGYIQISMRPIFIVNQ